MGKKVNCSRRTLWRGIGIFSLLMSLAAPSFAGVIYEDNFDSKPDWNADMSLNSTVCTPPGCTNAPSGWDGYRIMPSTGASGAYQTHNVPVISIQKPIGGLPDHTTGSGKAVVVYQASDLPDEPSVWKGDGQLAKVLSQQYPELYIRFWTKNQSNWQSVVGGALKMFRVTNWPGSSVSPNMFDQGYNHPSLFVDMSTWGSWAGSQAGYGAFFPAYRCSASPDDYYCANSGNYYENNYGDDWMVTPNGFPPTNYADTNWHRWDVHVKVNTIGSKNGIMTIAYDGQTLLTHNDMVFLESGTGRTGFNTVFLGGNSHNNYTQNGNQWYAIDDVVISTTAIPDNYVIGGGTTSSTSDTTAPSVSITAPASGASVTGTVSVSASASDNVGVSKVEFYVNGALAATDTATPYTYSWNTSALAAGSYTLTAKAYDAAGNSKSASVSVNVVKDTIAPTVSLTAPAIGATVSGTVAMTASASDNVGVSKVEFYSDGALLSASNVAPYSYNWSTTSTTNGSHTLLAKAYDAAGNVGLSSSVTVNVSNSTTSGGTSSTTPAGLVAAYSFDEGTGSTVTDKSGNGNNGTISGATWTTGKFGNALLFNGTSSTVTIPNSASLQLTNGMTLEAWVKPAATASSVWQDIIYKGDENYYLEASSKTSGLPMTGMTTATGYTGNYGTAVLAAGTWTHVAATYDGATLKYYANGVLVSSTAKSGAINTSTNPLQIGGDSLYGEYFNGTIDEVRVYNTALTQTQIQTDMANGIGQSSSGTSGGTTSTSGGTTSTSGGTTSTSGGTTSTSGGTSYTNPAGLVAAYSFDEGTGSTVTDKSGNGNNGTISGATWTTGKFGNALLFNGTNSMVTIPNSASLQLTSGMTLEAWVKPTKSATSVWQDIIYKGSENYYIEASSPTSGLPMVGMSTATGYTGNYGKGLLPASTWTHVAATYDGVNMMYYVNGVLISYTAKSGSINTSTYPLQIGGDSIYGEYFNGTIDEVRVYNTALTQSQIQADMAKGIGL